MKIYSKSIIAAALALCAAPAVLTGCSDDDDIPAFIKADERSFTLEYDGLNASGEQCSFNLGANASWQLAQKDQWLHLSKESGTRGSYTLFIYADENTTGEDRRGFIELKMGSITEQLSVLQHKKVNSLTVSPATIDINPLGLTDDGTNPVIKINSNVNYSIELPKDCDWIVPSATEGEAGKNEVAFTVAMNNSGKTRTAKVNVKGEDLTRSVTFRQSGEVFTFSTNKIQFEPGTKGESTEITVKVGCIETWKVTDKPQWLTISPDNGQAGETSVTLTAQVNEGDAREATVTLTTEHGIKMTVPVSQKATANLRPDDKPVGHEYYYDDFSWVEGGADQVSHINGGAPYDARNLYTWDFKGNGFSDVFATFKTKYIDLHPDRETIYAMDGYLKFDRGNTQTAIQIKNDLPIEINRYADVEITFRAAKNGTDKVTLSVMIEGDGNIVDGETGLISKPMEPHNNSDKTIPWTWTDMKVTVRGVTANTRITLGETEVVKTGNNRSGQYRWFLDDLKITRIETK